MNPHKYFVKTQVHENKDAENISLHHAMNWFYELLITKLLLSSSTALGGIFIFYPPQKIGKLFLMYVPPSRD